MPYASMMRGWVRDIDCMCAACDRWIGDDPPIRIRRRLIFARRSLGVARLAFLSILGLLGLAAI